MINIFRAKNVYDGLIKEVDKLFRHAIRNARITGKIVALALALGYPFGTQTVSLLGFSLGTQVIKSCIKTLHKLGAEDIIHNVYFLGGATHFEKDVEHWEKIFGLNVAGHIKNAYSRYDYILLLYHASQRHNSIGRHPQMITSQANMKRKANKQEKETFRTVQVGNVFLLSNYPNKLGHLDYRESMLEIHSMMKFE